MEIKSELVRALKIHKERTDDALAERSRQISEIQAQLAELLETVNDDLYGVGGVEIIYMEEQHTFKGANIALESLKITLAGQVVRLSPEIIDDTLQVNLSNLSPEYPTLKIQKQNGQWIVLSDSGAFQSQFTQDFFLRNLIELVNSA